LNRALNRAYNSRREQIKSACYSIGNWLAKNYDYVAFGDYTPTIDIAIETNMHRSMLNQSVIGTLRDTVKWVMIRSGKTFSLVDEKHTTSDCSICGYREGKDPSIREFTCPKCNNNFNRDIRHLQENNKPASGLFCARLHYHNTYIEQLCSCYGASPGTKYPHKLCLVIFFQMPK